MAIHSDYEEPLFFLNVFFLPVLFVFCVFFSGIVDMSLIHSIFKSGKKTTRKKTAFSFIKKIFLNSAKKTNLFREIKKYGNFDRTGKNIERKYY